jgi:hypothetical protein
LNLATGMRTHTRGCAARAQAHGQVRSDSVPAAVATRRATAARRISRRRGPSIALSPLAHTCLTHKQSHFHSDIYRLSCVISRSLRLLASGHAIERSQAASQRRRAAATGRQPRRPRRWTSRRRALLRPRCCGSSALGCRADGLVCCGRATATAAAAIPYARRPRRAQLAASSVGAP